MRCSTWAHSNKWEIYGCHQYHHVRHPAVPRRLFRRAVRLRMVLRSARFIRREVEETDALIRSAGHSGEIYFRLPYGHKFVMLPCYLWRTGRTTVTWDIEPDSYPDVASSASSIVVITASAAAEESHIQVGMCADVPSLC